MNTEWQAVLDNWPLIVAIAGLWARLEVALSKGRQQSESNAKDITSLEGKMDASDKLAGVQAVQLGRIEESLKGMGRTLDRIDRKTSGSS